MQLHDLGWDSVWSRHFEFTFGPDAGLEPARVLSARRAAYQVATASGSHAAALTGRFLHDAPSSDQLPATGDWVAVAARPGESIVDIHRLLERRSTLVRRAAGNREDAQVLAANVDTVFLLMGLDGNLNVRRLERFLVLVNGSGAEPVVVLTKADLRDDLGEPMAAVESVAPGVPIVALSALRGEGVDALGRWLWPGRTVVFLGSSGSGKSTLANRLLGQDRQFVQEVSDEAARGRHTTTAAEMLPLQEGAWIVDTPGLRELQLWVPEGEGLDETFADIDGIARRCRFRDCRHESEPGCAVRAAVESGELDQDRLLSRAKLEREAAHFAARQDRRLEAEKRAKWKKIAKFQRNRMKELDR